jgi:hypothetical protein
MPYAKLEYFGPDGSHGSQQPHQFTQVKSKCATSNDVHKKISPQQSSPARNRNPIVEA